LTYVATAKAWICPYDSTLLNHEQEDEKYKELEARTAELEEQVAKFRSAAAKAGSQLDR
jgi:cell division protein FtsB